MQPHGLESCESADMPPKKGYKQPGREGKVPIMFFVDEELRTAFKVATIEAGTSMQDALIAFIEEYSAATLKRLRQKG